MKKALITGGAGFIGSHLCELLVARGYEVTVVDNLVTGSLDNLSHLPSVRFIEADVNKPEVWQSLKKEKFDTLFHYAALVGVKRTEDQPMAVLEDVQGMRYVADFAVSGGAKKVIFASSSEVYGTGAQVPMPESAGVYGWSPYTVVKLFGEHMFKSLWEVHGIPTVSLRFFNVYGPRQIGSAYGFVVAMFVRQVLAGQGPTVFGDGQQTRDFVAIGDNVKAAVAAAESREAWGSVLNVGTGKETTVLDLADQVISVVGIPGIAPQFLPARDVEVPRRQADPSQMEQLLGTSCDTSLAEGLGDVIAFEESLLPVEENVATRSPAPATVPAP